MTDTVNVLSSDLRNIVTKKVPFITGAWVKFYDDMIFGEVTKAQNAVKTQVADLNLQSTVILNQISDWNFSDETGTKLPLSNESINRLSTRIIKWLNTAIGEVLTTSDAEGKKNTEGSNS